MLLLTDICLQKLTLCESSWPENWRCKAIKASHFSMGVFSSIRYLSIRNSGFSGSFEKTSSSTKSEIYEIGPSVIRWRENGGKATFRSYKRNALVRTRALPSMSHCNAACSLFVPASEGSLHFCQLLYTKVSCKILPEAVVLWKTDFLSTFLCILCISQKYKFPSERKEPEDGQLERPGNCFHSSGGGSVGQIVTKYPMKDSVWRRDDYKSRRVSFAEHLVFGAVLSTPVISVPGGTGFVPTAIAYLVCDNFSGK